MAAGVNFHVAGKTARLAIPAGARRIQLTVASIDPARRQYPVTYTVKLGEAMLATATLQTSPTQTLQIELPATRPPGAKLDLAVSRSWSPWGYGLGQALPIMELGVMYLDPVVE